MKQSKVSAEFLSVYQSNITGIEQAKQAESRVGNIPVPVGSTGICVIDDMRFDKAPDKKNADGTTKPGCPLFEVAYRIIGGDHQGKTVKYVQWMWQNANTSFADQYERVLNYMEKLGLPREVRVAHGSPDELFKWFSDHDNLTYTFEVKHNPSNTMDDGKYLVVNQIVEELPANADTMPPPQQPSAPAAPAAPAAAATPSSTVPEIKPGMEVLYQGKKFSVVEIYSSGKAHVKEVANPANEQLASLSHLQV